VSALAGAFEAASAQVARAEIREAVVGGAVTLKALLARLQVTMRVPAIDVGSAPKPPALVLSIDQSEELFLAEAQGEAQPFLTLLRDLLKDDTPPVIAIFTIRSDNYDRLQQAPELADIHKVPLDLGPMPKGSYAEVVKGPLRRLDSTARAIRMDDALVDALLADIEAGGAKDALPLLAFTLERVYAEYSATGHLTVDHYFRLGRVKGSIEAAVERAFKAAESKKRVPRYRQASVVLLRRGLIPWLAGIDPDTRAPRRRVARLSEIPAEARPLIDELVEQRLLSTDVARDTGEKTIEPAHDALLRQWGLLQGWLEEDTGLLTVLDGVKRAARDWTANARAPAWLAHGADRLRSVGQLLTRPDLAANLDPTDSEYVRACQRLQQAGRRKARWVQAMIYTMLLGIIVGLVAFINQDFLKEQYQWRVVMGPSVLTAEQEEEKAAKPGSEFKDCSNGCPTMIIVPAGKFTMGSKTGEGPEHEVTIAKPFAIGKFEVTFAEWDICVDVRACPKVSDNAWGRDQRPVISVNWDEARGYVTWLTRMTGREYRLLTEAEWEYAARAGSQTNYSFGENIFEVETHAWYSSNSKGRTQPVGAKKANTFGLYDMHGNVWEWVEDVWHESYEGAPLDSSAWVQRGDTSRHVVRGGSWASNFSSLRSAHREGDASGSRRSSLGFRVGRTLLAPAGGIRISPVVPEAAPQKSIGYATEDEAHRKAEAEKGQKGNEDDRRQISSREKTPSATTPPGPTQPPAAHRRLVKLTVKLSAQPREPEKGRLGVVMDVLELPLALSLGLPIANGVLVLEAAPGGPAAQAGIAFGDILVGLNGRPITQVGELRQQLAAMAPGTDAEVDLWRIAESGGDFLQTLRRLGEGGNAHVMFRLGRLYTKGIGLAIDDVEAVRWYRMGASASNLNATTALATALIEGRGTTKDEQESMRLLRAAADKDNHEALHRLGVILGQGKLVAKDTAEAMRLLARAADGGYVPSMLDLAALYNSAEGGPADPVKAAFWYKRAADLGNSTGMVNLGFMHQQGKGVERNDITAVALYRRAAAEGNSTSIHNLAAMLDSGRGVPRKDPEQAADLMLRALEMYNDFSYKQMTENSRAWSPEFRRALQRKLQSAGFYSGRIDGELGDTTISAIDAYVDSRPKFVIRLEDRELASAPPKLGARMEVGALGSCGFESDLLPSEKAAFCGRQ
jgi:formylglycine-generating enzyme required for sulfatase activity/TPR repeat protein